MCTCLGRQKASKISNLTLRYTIFQINWLDGVIGVELELELDDGAIFDDTFVNDTLVDDVLDYFPFIQG